jgi:hypothetical protein
MLFDEQVTLRGGASGSRWSLFGNHAGTIRKLQARASGDELNSIQMCRMKDSERFGNEKILLEIE